MKSEMYDTNYLFPSNPCFGCTSAACKMCVCFGEQPKAKAYDYQAPTKRKSTSRKAQLPILNDSNSTLSQIHITSIAKVPTGFFGTLGGGLVIQADGNGMIIAGIHTGDWLVFDTKLSPRDGDVAMVSVDGKTLCRRVFYEGAKKRIRREDGITPDIIIDNCVVHAVLVGLMRNVRESADIGRNT